VTDVSPDSVTLNKTSKGGKRSDRTVKMVINLIAVDAPGRSCDLEETSDPTLLRLRMVDGDGDVLIDSAKNGLVCKNDGVDRFGNIVDRNVKRNVFFQSPENCANSEIPSGNNSFGPITATVTGTAGTIGYSETITLKCNK
jgi:hypothetical protein